MSHEVCQLSLHKANHWNIIFKGDVVIDKVHEVALNRSCAPDKAVLLSKLTQPRKAFVYLLLFSNVHNPWKL